MNHVFKNDVSLGQGIAKDSVCEVLVLQIKHCRFVCLANDSVLTGWGCSDCRLLLTFFEAEDFALLDDG